VTQSITAIIARHIASHGLFATSNPILLLTVVLFFLLQIYQTGTEQFNLKPLRGITYLQEHELLSSPLDPKEVVRFIKENPKLDKKQIGEFISNKKYSAVLEEYQKYVTECLNTLATAIFYDVKLPFYRVRTDPGKSWNFIVQNSRPWKVLEKGIGPGKSWNCKPAVLELLVLV